MGGSRGRQQPYKQVLAVPYFTDKEVRGTPGVWELRQVMGQIAFVSISYGQVPLLLPVPGS